MCGSPLSAASSRPARSTSSSSSRGSIARSSPRSRCASCRTRPPWRPSSRGMRRPRAKVDRRRRRTPSGGATARSMSNCARRAPRSVRDGGIRMRWPVEVPPRGTARITFALEAHDRSAVVAAAATAGRRGAPRPRRADDRLARWVDRALDDLDALRLTTTRAPGDEFLAAGAPWFFTLFGRDSIWAARLLLPLGAGWRARTLRVLAALQGRDAVAETAEQPGKIMHELRAGARAPRRGAHASPRSTTARSTRPRSGSACSPTRATPACPTTRCAAAAAPRGRARLDARLRRQRRRRPARVRRRDRSRPRRTRAGRTAATRSSGATARSPTGRSRSARCRATPTRRPCAAPTCSTRSGATAATSGAPGPRASRRVPRGVLDRRPRRRLPRDRARRPKRPVDTVTSNIGHLLGTGLLDARGAALVARRLVSPELDSGFGLRTMSTDSAGYWPLSYHGGSVWTHDTAIAILGLARDGFAAEAAALVRGAAARRGRLRLPDAGAALRGRRDRLPRARAVSGGLPPAGLVGRRGDRGLERTRWSLAQPRSGCRLLSVATTCRAIVRPARFAPIVDAVGP